MVQVSDLVLHPTWAIYSKVHTLDLHDQREPFFKIYLLIYYFWLRWVFVAAHGLSVVVASGGYSLLRCMRGLLIVVASLAVEHGL